MKNQRYVIPFHFKGAPRPSVMMDAEIRFVRDERSPNFGKVRVYLDSQYNPILDELSGHYVSFEEATEILKKHGGIAVKDDFDMYSIEDLREIKDQLSREWIDDFNESLRAY